MNNHILIKIGKKIREIRQQQNLTLQEIAESAQISKGMLSKIENGRTVPSLPVLLTIVQSLKIDIKTFFENIELEENKLLYIHKKKSEYIPTQKEEAVGFTYHSVLSHNIGLMIMDVVVLNLDPNSQREPVTTDGYELKFVIKGEITYQLGNETIVIQEGDTLFFDGKIPHVPMNRTNEIASMLVVYFLSPTNGN